MSARHLLDALASGRTALGMGVHLDSPAIVEMAGFAGYDWISIIHEHAALSVADIERLQVAADLRSLTTLVHVTGHDDPEILRLLNAGVGGVVAPHATSAGDVERLVEISRFPPLGERGAHGSVRSASYGALGYEEYVARADGDVAVGVVIEDAEGVERADEILAVPGLTLAFMGLLDLSQSYGVPGRFDAPPIRDAIAHVTAVARERGIVLASSHYGYSLEELHGFGFQMIVSPSAELGFFQRALRDHVDAARQTLSEREAVGE